MPCEHCGTHFMPKSSIHRFCSERCRDRAYQPKRNAYMRRFMAERQRKRRAGEVDWRGLMPAAHQMQGGMCAICVEPLDDKTSELDHVRPVSQGGEDNANNAALLHKYCHRARRTSSYMLTRDRLGISQAVYTSRVSGLPFGVRVRLGYLESWSAGEGW